MANFLETIVYNFFQYLPSFCVCLNFLSCGLAFGYTISSFVAKRDLGPDVLQFGPLILGMCWVTFIGLGVFMMKFLRGRISFWHINTLICAAVFNFLASGFFFAEGLASIGSFISYLAHGLIFMAGLSFLHSIPGKCTRAIWLSLCFCFYLLGIASAVCLIGTAYGKNLDKKQPDKSSSNDQALLNDIYVSFAAVYMSVAAIILTLMIGLKILSFLGNVDCDTSMDNEFRIANSNGTVFDKRSEVIKRIQFFYVTKNQQWNVTLVLLFTEAVEYAIFIYTVFWLSLNGAVRLTPIPDIDLMLWTVFVGSIVSTFVLIVSSAKVLFVANQLSLIALTIISMIVYSSIQSIVPVWLILFFFGMSFSNLQIIIVEVSHFLFTEILIGVSYVLKLLSTSIVYYYYVANTKNSYFYSTDEATLMAHGFGFIIIIALLALVVGMKVPRTFRVSLFDIQYGLLGIIFKKHQIEQLNVKWLNDGTIPTIIQPPDN